jgi:hypothetical protein
MDDTEILKRIDTAIAALIEARGTMAARVDTAIADPAYPADAEIDFLSSNLITTSQAAERAGVDVSTIRRWCEDYGIGRQMRPRGNWQVSAPRLHRQIRTM